MFWREHARYIITILIAIGLAIFVFVLLFKSITGGSNGSQANNKPAMTQYIKGNTSMDLTAEGPIAADQTYQSLHISVNANEATVEVRSGYDNQITSSDSYASNSAAYDEFIRALSILGYDKGNDSSSVADEKGYCPTGVRYIFAIEKDGKEVQRYWRGSCGVGSFRGKYPQIVALFKAQIPDYYQQTKILKFGL